MPDGAYVWILIWLLFLVLALLLGRRLLRQGNNHLESRYKVARNLCILYGILIPLMVVAAFERPDPSWFKRFLSPGCFTVAFGIFFYQFLVTRRKLRAQSGFKAKASHLPTLQLLWQVAFVLLPVIGLAVFGLYSLRQDRLLAEQQAQESGEVLAQQLAQTLSKAASQSLRDYREASFELHANRTADLGLSQWAGGIQSESNAWQYIKNWQQANPEIDLATLPPVELEEYYEPRPETMPPETPAWVGQLSPEQQRLWQAAKETALGHPNFAAAQAAIQKFLAAKPPAAARGNAEYLLLLAKTHGLTTPEAAAQFIHSTWSQSDQLTEAGLPVGQLIWYQGLRLLPEGGGLPAGKNVDSIAWAITYRPSMLSPRLIAEVERVTKHTEAATKAATLKAFWETGEKARQVWADLRDQHPTNTWATEPYWVNSRVGDFLLILGDRWVVPTNWVAPLEPRYTCLMLPQAVVIKSLTSAVDNADFSLPGYAAVRFEFGGKAIPLSGKQPPETSNHPFPLLGQADGMLKDLPLNAHSYPFRIRVFLASPDILYARQAQRSRWFGALIVASAVAALMGLFSAYRSFRRELSLNAMKTNFVSSVSHELRAPIASVRLMAENLESGKIPEPEKQREYFRFIGQECRRLSSLIENVLDFSRIEQGRKQYEFEPTDLVALTRTTIQLMEPYAAEKGVLLELIPSSGQSLPNKFELEVDGRAIQQALVNLMDNAIKHSAKGQTVTLEIGPDGETSFSVSVCDHGPGIPKTEQERIFERFYRLGSELRRETQGIGIGLSIVKHIVTAHGGSVTVASAPGQGSRFTISLPAKT